MNRVVDIMVGLQWGSEGKGKFAAALADRYGASVRVGGPNAGHTFYYRGDKYVNRSIPCAWVNPFCQLYIGAGAVIDLDTLGQELEECEMLSGISITPRLTVDRNAVIITSDHIEEERSTLSHMGSTMHGIGAAIMTKIRRKEGTGPLVKHVADGYRLRVTGKRGIFTLRVGDVAEQLHSIIDAGDRLIMLEGTQGTLLSLDHGTWPWVTGRNVLASSILSDCGLGPLCVREVYGVMRTYPIRVGGPSGPMGHEVTWDEVARNAGLPEGLSETTTVTGRVRRVASIDRNLLREAAQLNGITQLFVAFLDYLDGRIRTNSFMHYDNLPALMNLWPHIGSELAGYAAAARTPIGAVSWGPDREQGLYDCTVVQQKRDGE
jgi:adenylosuccinate synthase